MEIGYSEVLRWSSHQRHHHCRNTMADPFLEGRLAYAVTPERRWILVTSNGDILETLERLTDTQADMKTLAREQRV